MAIQPRFDAHGPPRFSGGEHEHPERVRVQLDQLVHRHQHGQQVISLIGQRNQILGTVIVVRRRGLEQRCVYIIGQLSRRVNYF